MTLNEGLETISEECFDFAGLEEVVIPNSVRLIDRRAFNENNELE